MLKNLIKLDLRFIYKELIVYYIATIVAGLLGLLLHTFTGNNLLTFLSVFLANTSIGLLIGLSINAVVRLWVRFSISFYGDEAYLTHTLPITKSQIYLGKFLSSLIVVGCNLVMAIVTFIIYFVRTPEFDWRIIFDHLPLVITGVIVFLLEVIFMIQNGFLGAILGHRKLTHHGAFSILFGAISHFAFSALLLVGFLVIGIFDPAIQSIMFDNLPADLDLIGKILAIGTLLYIGFIAAIYFISQRLLTRGVNVD